MRTKKLHIGRNDHKAAPATQARRARGILSQRLLRAQNIAYAGTGGVSCNNRSAEFVPGYMDTESGVAVVSRFADGRPAPIHVLDGLPEGWIRCRNASGQVSMARAGVVAGFLRGGRFYTREEAARLLSSAVDGPPEGCPLPTVRKS